MVCTVRADWLNAPPPPFSNERKRHRQRQRRAAYKWLLWILYCSQQCTSFHSAWWMYELGDFSKRFSPAHRQQHTTTTVCTASTVSTGISKLNEIAISVAFGENWLLTGYEVLIMLLTWDNNKAIINFCKYSIYVGWWRFSVEFSLRSGAAANKMKISWFSSIHPVSIHLASSRVDDSERVSVIRYSSCLRQ